MGPKKEKETQPMACNFFVFFIGGDNKNLKMKTLAEWLMKGDIRCINVQHEQVFYESYEIYIYTHVQAHTQILFDNLHIVLNSTGLVDKLPRLQNKYLVTGYY